MRRVHVVFCHKQSNDHGLIPNGSEIRGRLVPLQVRAVTMKEIKSMYEKMENRISLQHPYFA